MVQRITEHEDEAMGTIKNLEKNYEILTNTTKDSLNIEKSIINFIKTKDAKELLEIANTTKLEANKAYIYYNIWQYSNDDNYKEKSLKIFNNLYKEKPKYRFKHFIKELS